MNNLHRGLAPISDSAWAQIEEEASRTLKRHLAARHVVDVEGPKGTDFAAVGTGHQKKIATPGDGIEAAQRETKALVELRVPFELT
ncbi:MAG TPA: family 1 encapsulin nanocompartment shell protein, partial [Bradyrhizobium sp.]